MALKTPFAAWLQKYACDHCNYIKTSVNDSYLLDRFDQVKQYRNTMTVVTLYLTADYIVQGFNPGQWKSHY